MTREGVGPRTPRAAPAALALLLAAQALVLAAAGCGGDRPARGRRAVPDATASTQESAAGTAAPGAATPDAASPDAGAPGTAAATRTGEAAPQAAAGTATGPGSAATPTGPTSAPVEPNHREVVLFFQRPDDDMLGPERRRILLTPSVADQARQIVSELAVGPETDELLPTVPRRTTVLGIFIDRGGTAYVDLSEEFVSTHPGGSSEELATILSVVDSLTYNLPEIKRVRFLVGGEERDTLKEHLDLRAAYLKDMSIVRMEDGG